MTVAQLSVDEELEPLAQIAARRGWTVERQDETSFILNLPARDDSSFWLLCRCDGYPGLPPRWHWYNPETKAIDQPLSTPGQNLTMPPGENLTVRRGDEPQFVATS